MLLWGMDGVELIDEKGEVETKDAERPRSLYGFPVRSRDNRTANPGERKTYDIKQLWDRNKEILNLNSLGYKGSEIAKMLNITPVAVSMTLNSTLGKEAKVTLREERDIRYEGMRDKIADLTEKALDVYNEVLESSAESSKLKVDVANTIALELAGLRAPTQIQTMNTNTTLTAEELADFKKRGHEAAKAAGKLVEIEE